MASTDIKPEYDHRTGACRNVTILFFVIFLSMFCTLASAYTYSGEIASISISPSTIHRGDSITHAITVINTGDDGLPIKIQVSGGDDSAHTLSNVIVPVGQPIIITLFTTAPAVDSGQITFTYQLYWSKTSSDQLLDTETRSVYISQSTPSTGSLSVTSSPSGAGIYVDGSYRGITPLTLSGLTTGSHTIRISQSGYNDYSTTATVYAGQTTTVSGTLTPSGQNGSISVTSSPSSASVYLDGSYRGITPLTLSGLTTGSHTIRISQSGYNDYSTTVPVYAGQTTTVSGTLTTSGQTGSISVTSSPSGASVYLDGSYQGVTSITLSGLLPGSHTLRISKSGYNEYSATVTVYAGETAIVSRTLSSSGQTGSISVTSSPSEASVYLDGSYQGVTSITLSGLLPGSHTLRISKSGYNEYSATVTVYAGETATVSRTLIPSYTTSQTGSIAVTSSPSRASVYADGSYQGTTPIILSDLTTGSHTIRISQSGYNDYSATVTVYAWQTTTVTGILSAITPVPTTSPTTPVPAAPVPQTPGSFDPLGLIILLIIGVFVVVAGYFGYTQIMRARTEKTSSSPEEPVKILKMRYAKGELTTEEYLHMLENLKK